ncbi:uncharacterized protein LOC133800888 [Humulus lupulus]|uniref:uncharacterized protein LOC133800888 n=1 Tax=Humulus lupulus TaxID=3486 RepID=UPI002B4025D3|nr:uncharacterized protein LOC133800888 [Humulus lupulus]
MATYPNVYDFFTTTPNYAVVARPLAIIGGAYLAFAYLHSGGWWKERTPRVRKRSVTLATLQGGEMALQRLKDYQEARANAQNLDGIEKTLKKLLLSSENELQELDFPSMQRIVAKIEMTGNEERAVQLLKKKLDEEINPYEAYEIEMLLVEMLIYKGNYKGANIRKCLTEQKISDARRPLYQAIISMALEPSKTEEAEEYWNDFIELRTHFSVEPAFRESMEEIGIFKISTNFQEFQMVVKKLQEDINKEQEKRLKSDWFAIRRLYFLKDLR